MILTLGAAAFADPIALRGPLDAPSLAAGLRSASVAVPVGEHFSVALDGRYALDRIGGWGAWRPIVPTEDGVWRLDGVLAAGAHGDPLTGTPGVDAMVGVAFGAVGQRWTGGVGLAVPAALDLPSGSWSVPLLAELQVGVRLGPVWVAARAAGGPTWARGESMVTTWEPALWVGYKGGADADKP